MSSHQEITIDQLKAGSVVSNFKLIIINCNNNVMESNIVSEAGERLSVSFAFSYNESPNGRKTKRTKHLFVVLPDDTRVGHHADKIRFKNVPGNIGQPKYNSTGIINFFKRVKTYQNQVQRQEDILGKRKREKTSPDDSVEKNIDSEKTEDEEAKNDVTNTSERKTISNEHEKSPKRGPKTIRTDVIELIEVVSKFEEMSGLELFKLFQYVIEKAKNPKFQPQKELEALAQEYEKVVDRIEQIICHHDPHDLYKVFVEELGGTVNQIEKEVETILKKVVSGGSKFHIGRPRRKPNQDYCTQASLMNLALKELDILRIGRIPKDYTGDKQFSNICKEWKELFFLIFLSLSNVKGVGGKVVQGRLLGCEFLINLSLQHEITIVKGTQSLFRSVGAKYSTDAGGVVLLDLTKSDEEEEEEEEKPKKTGKKKKKKKPKKKKEKESGPGEFNPKILDFVFNQGVRVDITKELVGGWFEHIAGTSETTKFLLFYRRSPDLLEKKIAKRKNELVGIFLDLIEPTIHLKVKLIVDDLDLEDLKKNLQKLRTRPTYWNVVSQETPKSTGLEEQEEEEEEEGEENEEDVNWMVMSLEYKETESTIKTLESAMRVLQMKQLCRIKSMKRIVTETDRIFDVVSPLPEFLVEAACVESIRKYYPAESGSDVYFRCDGKDEPLMVVFNKEGAMDSGFVAQLMEVGITLEERK